LDAVRTNNDFMKFNLLENIYVGLSDCNEWGFSENLIVRLNIAHESQTRVS